MKSGFRSGKHPWQKPDFYCYISERIKSFPVYADIQLSYLTYDFYFLSYLHETYDDPVKLHHNVHNET